VAGEDELAVLGININLMADQLQTLLQEQKAETKRTQLFAFIDRLEHQGNSKVLVESLAPNGISVLGVKLQNMCFQNIQRLVNMSHEIRTPTNRVIGLPILDFKFKDTGIGKF
jgi:signal transduction histidine kinase